MAKKRKSPGKRDVPAVKKDPKDRRIDLTDSKDGELPKQKVEVLRKSTQRQVAERRKSKENDPLTIQEKEKLVWNLHLDGYTDEFIVKMVTKNNLGYCTPVQVQNIIKKKAENLYVDPRNLNAVRRLKSSHLQRFLKIYRQVSKAWKLSSIELEEKAVKTKKNGRVFYKKTYDKKQVPGDPRYVQLQCEILEKIGKLFGFEAPTEISTKNVTATVDLKEFAQIRDQTEKEYIEWEKQAKGDAENLKVGVDKTVLLPSLPSPDAPTAEILAEIPPEDLKIEE